MDSIATDERLLFVSEPHAAHLVMQVEDHTAWGMRIYEVRQGRGRLGFTGEEMDSLATWWAAEKQRVGSSDADDYAA